jgi:hypothetical protein
VGNTLVASTVNDRLAAGRFPTIVTIGSSITACTSRDAMAAIANGVAIGTILNRIDSSCGPAISTPVVRVYVGSAIASLPAFGAVVAKSLSLDKFTL